MGKPNFWSAWYGAWDLIGFLVGGLLPFLLLAAAFGVLAFVAEYLMRRFK